jgi:aspartate--ammonia ligase
MNHQFTYPEGYASPLNILQNEKAIKLVKDHFEQNLSSELRLRRVTAPLFVFKGTGINDDLNGIERKVSFAVPSINNQEAEVVNSLAKWKRLALAELNISHGYGLYTDMNAIRPDETLDATHSLYVDQWDWEIVISEKERHVSFLKKIVQKIYEVLKRTEFIVYEQFGIEPILPDNIVFIHSEDLLKRYPHLSVEERERKAAKRHGAVFIMGIGAVLSNGEPHDSRAPDYDDWITLNSDGRQGLNGDILLWNPVLNCAFEISSMGIRVDKRALSQQLEATNTTDRKELYFHKKLLNDELPLSMGGGIGQSRLAMFFLRKAHIGEVQCSLWPKEVKKECSDRNIFLLE